MASEEKTSAADIPLESHQEVTSAAEFLLESHEEVTSAAEFLVKSHEEVTSAAEFLLESHQEVTSAAEFLVKSHEEVTSAVDIPLKSHQELVPWTMAREEIENSGCAADIPVQSFFECVSCRTSSTDQQIIDRSDEVSLDINEIATSLRDQLKTKRVFSSERCIYRVPETLRVLNEKAYAPRVVSIGPIHHGKENLKAIEDHKITYLHQFLEESEVSVEDLINIVNDNETDLRDCYAETIDLSRKDFATMILLDAVFVIMFLLNANYERESLDHIFFRPWKLHDVMWDMCLLENQLPLFILEVLLERYSAAGANPRNSTVIELTSRFLPNITGGWVKEDSWKTIDSSEVLHFVDFIRKCQQPTEQSCEEREMVTLSAPTATELHQSGVKFKKSESNLLLDIRFSDGILEIPRLTISDRTETFFRNLHAFEQCHHLTDVTFVSDYMTFISCLVRAPNDVEVLVQNESWKNLLNSNEAASNLINKIRQDYFRTDGFLIDICEELTSHCKKRRHKWKATLKQVYFSNPWTAISVAAATFLLMLTVIQTVCSILQL